MSGRIGAPTSTSATFDRHFAMQARMISRMTAVALAVHIFGVVISTAVP
jgi:hypothetical protein